MTTRPYQGFRFPKIIIQQAIWLWTANPCIDQAPSRVATTRRAAQAEDRIGLAGTKLKVGAVGTGDDRGQPSRDASDDDPADYSHSLTP